MNEQKELIKLQKKFKQDYPDDMKKTWGEKPLHGRYPLRTNNRDVDRTTTQQWLSRSSLKRETEAFILAVQDENVSSKDP